jgi:hypothetical protein
MENRAVNSEYDCLLSFTAMYVVPGTICKCLQTSISWEKRLSSVKVHYAVISSQRVSDHHNV